MAFIQTLEHLQRAGIAAFGGGKKLREAHAPLWIERNGLRIAVLGYNEFLPRSFKAGPNWPGVAWSEDSEGVTDIRAARLVGRLGDSIHALGSGEGAGSQPTSANAARLMIDAGADAVAGAIPT